MRMRGPLWHLHVSTVSMSACRLRYSFIDPQPHTSRSRRHNIHTAHYTFTHTHLLHLWTLISFPWVSRSLHRYQTSSKAKSRQGRSHTTSRRYRLNCWSIALLLLNTRVFNVPSLPGRNVNIKWRSVEVSLRAHLWTGLTARRNRQAAGSANSIRVSAPSADDAESGRKNVTHWKPLTV